jgi:hypothetical protein
VTDLDEQLAGSQHDWQSRSIGAYLIAVLDLSLAACAFATAFKEVSRQDLFIATSPHGKLPAEAYLETRGLCRDAFSLQLHPIV